MVRHKCLILGASGLVGQRLQQRLAQHPMFEIGAVAGSSSTAGEYLDTIEWRLSEARPRLPNLRILGANSAELAQECHKLGIKIAFSGLPANAALTVEKELTDSGIMVFSNASAFRRVPGIPLVIPEINPHHLHRSLHYCATNCTLIPLAIPVSIISNLTNIKSVTMRSEQALSGAGWELLSDQAALSGSVDPHIEGEAEKTETELLYVLGAINSDNVIPASFDVNISCERVSRVDGHQVFVKVTTENSIQLSDLLDALNHQSDFHHLPSSPSKPIHLVERVDPESHLWSNGTEFASKPNPAGDLKIGMAVVVGDISVEGNQISFSAYSHNTIRGAAGGLVYLAEIVVDKFLA